MADSDRLGVLSEAQVIQKARTGVLPMCATCAKIDEKDGRCRVHGPVPRQYLVELNDCPDWEDWIPL